MLCLVAQLCPTLCNPMDCSLPDPSVHGDSPGENTGVGCHSLPQGIVSAQGLNPGLPHYRWILYHLSQQGSPRILEWVSLFQAIFLTQELIQGLLHCRQILYQPTSQGSPRGWVRWGKDLESITREPESLALAGRLSCCEPPGEAQ